MLPKISLIAAVLLLVSVLVCAQEVPAQVQESAQGQNQQTAKQEKEYPDFEEVTKDMEELRGLFNLWYYWPANQRRSN